MRNRRPFRSIAALLCALLLTGAPVHAGPIIITDVMQVVGSYQNPPELRLRSLTQGPSTPISGIKGSIVSSGAKQTGDDTGGTVAPTATGSLLSGVANDPQRGVEIIDQGEVEGTICDCGDILLPGAFPKWPLLFLAAIPLFFINTGGGDIRTPTFTPTPPLSVNPTTGPTPGPTPMPGPQQTPVPEPASLLLFGSGLAAVGAGLRRRYLKAKSATTDGAGKEA